ncbi:hypothetical protein OAU87_03060 [Alphaproteobacteria bacterium]|nr:hypothetical protein [Alphaproteobacteria bacterium]
MIEITPNSEKNIKPIEDWLFLPIAKADFEEEQNIDEHLNTKNVNIKKTIGGESAQNAKDAQKDENNKSVISFKWVEVANDDFFLRYIQNLIPHTNEIDKVEFRPNDQEKTNPNFLIVEDFNTTGIDGKDENDSSNYRGFWRKLGVSTKRKDKGGGRGLGRSVYAIASKLRCFFALSNPQDTNEEYLMGVFLGSPHEYQGKRYKANSRFCSFVSSSKDPEFNPIKNKDHLSELKNKLNLDRKNTNGTSIIVPYPTNEIWDNKYEIISTLVENYLPVIAMGELIVRASWEDISIEINKNNVDRYLSDYGLHDKLHIHAFLKNCFEKNSYDAELMRVDHLNKTLDKEDFKKEDLDLIIDSFEKNELIKIKVPFLINSKEHGKIDTFIDYYIQKTKDNLPGKAIFLRKFMPLFEEGKSFNYNCNIFINIQDKGISEFIKASEGVNHSDIDYQHNDLSKFYIAPYKHFVSLIINSPFEFSKILFRVREEKDINSFSEYFPDKINNLEGSEIEDDDVTVQPKHNGDNPKPPKPPRPPKPIVEPIFKYGYLNNGFKVSINSSKENIEGLLPVSAKIDLAYSIDGVKRAIDKYEKEDFDISDQKKFTIELKECEILNHTENNLRVKFNSSNSSISIKGFQEDFDLEVRIRKENVL